MVPTITRGKRHSRTFSLMLALATALAGRADAQLTAGSVTFSDVTVVGKSEAIGSVMGTALDRDGNVYVLDPDNGRVLKFAPDGSLLWQSGRKGGGPGEYQLPTRIAIGPASTVYVYDMARQGLTVLDSTGAYQSYARVSPPVRNPDKMVVLDDGRLVLSGIAEFARGAGHAVHVYSSEFNHLHSFGELPIVKHARNARLWGAGGITHGPAGTILFSRRLPYEISQYTPDGTLVRQFRADMRFELTPDDAYVNERNGSQVVTSLGADVPRPYPAIMLGNDHFLSGLGRRENPEWHLYSLADGFLGEVELPAGWSGVLGYDRDRGYIWGYGEHNLEPVLFRAKVQGRVF